MIDCPHLLNYEFKNLFNFSNTCSQLWPYKPQIGSNKHPFSLSSSSWLNFLFFSSDRLFVTGAECVSVCVCVHENVCVKGLPPFIHVSLSLTHTCTNTHSCCPFKENTEGTESVQKQQVDGIMPIICCTVSFLCRHNLLL